MLKGDCLNAQSQDMFVILKTKGYHFKMASGRRWDKTPHWPALQCYVFMFWILQSQSLCSPAISTEIFPRCPQYPPAPHFLVSPRLHSPAGTVHTGHGRQRSALHCCLLASCSVFCCSGTKTVDSITVTVECCCHVHFGVS